MFLLLIHYISITPIVFYFREAGALKRKARRPRDGIRHHGKIILFMFNHQLIENLLKLITKSSKTNLIKKRTMVKNLIYMLHRLLSAKYFL